MSDWSAHFEREQARYGDGDQRLAGASDADARQGQLTRIANAAYGAGLALLMAGRRDEADEWFARAAERYRESHRDAPPGSWGRPIGALKARILAGDWDAAADEARWTLELGAGEAESPIARYAAALAYLTVGEDDQARIHADAIRTRPEADFPVDVGDTLAMIAAGTDAIGYVEAIESVLDSFETRGEYLEEVPVADTVIVLRALAERRDLHAELASSLLPPSED